MHKPAVAVAARILHDMHETRHPLPYYQSQYQDHPQATLISHLVLGTCRFYPWLDDRLQSLLHRPLKEKQKIIGHLCHVAMYQTRWLGQPVAITVDQAVRSCQVLNAPWATKLVNYVLRAHLRMQLHPILHAHPLWLFEAIKTQWPEDWPTIIAANNSTAAIHLRCHHPRTALLQACKEQGIVARAHPSVASAIIVNEHTHIPSCPGYEEGWFYVQDAGAQMAATLLPVQQGGRVLDACAGVGGKTTHLATLHQYQSIVALDSNKEHFERLQQNIDRLKCQPVTVVHAALEDYKDPEGFDAILLDAPCSATGTIARHPEIKVIRKPGDHPDQSLLLKAAWGLLKPGGYLLYTTCSILASENEDIIATLDPPWSEIPLSFGHKRRYGVQLLPKECWNGFYYCLLQKP